MSYDWPAFQICALIAFPLTAGVPPLGFYADGCTAVAVEFIASEPRQHRVDNAEVL